MLYHPAQDIIGHLRGDFPIQSLDSSKNCLDGLVL